MRWTWAGASWRKRSATTRASSRWSGQTPAPWARDTPDGRDLAVVDVSFISLDRILGPVATCFGPLGGLIVALVKPQFEAGRQQVRDGVVRDPRYTARRSRQ